MKYDIPLLDRNTWFPLWQVKMRTILLQMDLEEALLGFDKMSSSWIAKERKKKDNKAMTQIHLHLLNDIL